MAKKAAIFEYMLKHSLVIEVRDGKVMFDESKQKIFLMSMSIKPAMEIARVEAIAHYPNGTEKTVAEAVRKILNAGAKASAKREPMARKSNTLLSANDIRDTREIKEAEQYSQIPDMSVQVITDMLDIQTQIDVDGGSFSIRTIPDEMAEFVTFRQSKKIKVFINGKEFAPKEEMEFIKKIFPQIDMTLYFK